MKKIITLLLLLSPSIAHEYKLGDLKIDHPFIRLPPNGAKVAGGFVIITNMGKETDRLVAASSQFSAKTEVHEMSMDNGVMRMRELPKGIEIKAGETLTLKSGSYHIMFMGLASNLKAGEAQKATLVFEKAGKIEVDFNVEPMTGMHHAH